MAIDIACIVEGHGEVFALPGLVRRIGWELDPPAFDLRVALPIRVHAGSFLFQNDRMKRQKEIERAVALALAKTGRMGAVLVLMDLEDGCPAKMSAEILPIVRAAAAGRPAAVTFAFREYETWFLAAARSLRGVAELPDHLETPKEAESIRDAKGWLDRHLPNGYRETVEQEILTHRFSLEEAATVSSFRKLRRDVESLISQLRAEAS